MADDRLRALERAALAGDPDARARLLRERVRAGALPPVHVALAAFLGDPSARRALAGAAPAEPERVAALVDGLERWGREPLARASVAAAAAALPALRGQGEATAREGLDAARAALDGREVEVDAALERVQFLAHLAPEELLPDAPPAEEVGAAGDEARDQAIAAANAAVFAGRAVRGAVHVTCWLARGASLFSIAHHAREALFDAVGAVGEPAVLAAVRADLVAWALA